MKRCRYIERCPDRLKLHASTIAVETYISQYWCALTLMNRKCLMMPSKSLTHGPQNADFGRRISGGEGDASAVRMEAEA